MDHNGVIILGDREVLDGMDKIVPNHQLSFVCASLYVDKL